MTVKRLIELLEEIENKDLQVMCDASEADAEGFHLVALTDATEVMDPMGNEVVLLMHSGSELFDEDGERVN